MPEQICNTSECGCTAVAYGINVGPKVPLCVRCAIKIQIMDGPESLEVIPGAKWPWSKGIKEYSCPHCGAKYNNHLKGQDEECPKCRRNL